MPSNPTYLGTVQDVQGANISVALDKDTVSGLAFIEGRGYRIGQIGSFVRISIGFIDLFGIVSQVGAGAVPETLRESEPFGYRWLKIQLIGEGQRGSEFKRGISQYPTIGDEVHLVTEQDLARIYGRPDSPNFIRIGSLASAESIPALVDINRLVTRHSAIVGSTGVGKSTTVANILLSLSDPKLYPSTRIIILDLHGEYYSAMFDRAEVFRVNADESKGEKPLHIPYWALSFDELLHVTPFRDLNDSDKAALVNKIQELKRTSLTKKKYEGTTSDTMTVDSPIPFSINKLWYDLYRTVFSTHYAHGENQCEATEAIEESGGKPLLGDIMNLIPPTYKPIKSTGSKDEQILNSRSPLNIRRQLHALQSLLRDTRYDFLFRPGPWCPTTEGIPEKDIDDLLSLWIGGNKTVTILDLSGVPISILIDLIGVLIRLLFDALFWARYLPEGGRSRPLLFVLEEAHTYLHPGQTGAASIAARRVVKEGRKYGLGAMIISQRPSEIDPTILSQCGTIIAMRLSNASDRSQITGTVSDNLEGLFNMLSILRTGEAIIVGESVNLPLRTLIDSPPTNRRPDSNDPKIFDSSGNQGWNKRRKKENYRQVLKNWRSEKI